MARPSRRRPWPLDLDPTIKGVNRSYDVIGDLIVIKIPRHLDSQAREIGSFLLRRNPRARLVLQVVGETEDGTRVRRLRPVAGTGSTTTKHREHGATYVVDISRVFFSPRLSYERWRVAQQVEEGERIVNMFAGVGSFSILIARQRRSVVYSIDNNTAAIECMRQGILANKLIGKVYPILGDAGMICPGIGGMDRVLLPLPSLSDEMFPIAVGMLGPKGIVHHYREVSGGRKECIAGSLKVVDETLDGIDYATSSKVLASRIVRSVGPKKWHVVHDILFISSKRIVPERNLRMGRATQRGYTNVPSRHCRQDQFGQVDLF